MGCLAGRMQWVSRSSIKDLSNLVFLLLAPALLFRSMSRVHLEQLDFKPVAVYFLAVGFLFAAVLIRHGFSKHSTVIALASIFSNTVMIGIPLVGLAYGETALAYLFTLISLHALVLLTIATIVLEYAVIREQRHIDKHNPAPHNYTQMAKSVLIAVKNAVIHPVPLPIILGLLFAQTAWQIPNLIDKPLQVLGSAFSPMALILVGITLSYTVFGSHLKGLFGIVVVKNMVLPLLVAALGWVFGLSGLPLTVMVVAASLPIGANVFLFSQRYEVAEDLITASVALTTALALITVTITMSWLGPL
jgi:malonate transporter and related proteins